MTQTFFKTIFANTGDVATIPLPAQISGAISFEKGYPVNYQEDPATVPAALDIDREQFNYLMNLITANIQVLQVHGIPDFITSAANGGTAYSYDINSIVRFTGGWATTGAANYISLIAANTTDPTTQANWGLISVTPAQLPGTIKYVSDFTNLPAGYIWANGKTIGNASSNATGRANADTLALFSIYWTYSAATLPIFTSAGALSTRGSTAAADFSANKAISIPNLMGSVLAGLDGMGGAPNTNNLTVVGSGISGVTAGATGGSQSVSLTANQNGAHAHGPGGGGNTFTEIASSGSLAQYSAGNPDHLEIYSPTTGVSGSGAPHLNVQSTIVMPVIIALGTV
jgi:microcystin-dependent protein